MSGSGHVTPRRLHEQVVRAVTGRIVSGKLAAGASLPSEAEMCVEYGVSRSSVREALRVLSEKGLIEVRHGLGTRVNPPERWSFLDALVLNIRREKGAMVGMFRDLLEARRIVECEVAALAAERADSHDLKRLTDALETMHDSLDDPATFAKADFDFHRALLEATRNRVLVRIAEPIRELLEYSLQTTDSLADVLQRAYDDHAAIYEAIRKGDAVAARERMRLHLERTANDVAAPAGPRERA